MHSIKINPNVSLMKNKPFNKINNFKNKNIQNKYIKNKTRVYTLFLYVIHIILTCFIVCIIYNHKSPETYKLLNNNICFIKYTNCDKFIPFLISISLIFILLLFFILLVIEEYYHEISLQIYKKISDFINFIDFIVYYYFDKDQIVIIQIIIVIYIIIFIIIIFI